VTRYLVTGGAGFIGSHIAERLLRQGHEVRILDNFSTSFPENLEALPEGYELIEGDLRNRADVERSVEGVEVIFHQAALPSVPRSIEDPLTSNAVNVEGTLNLLWVAHHAKVRRLMFASSSSVYGENPESPKREDMPLQPLSPYAATKAMGEYYCKIFNDLYGLETVCLRYFNVFGPRQDPSSPYSGVISKFIDNILSKTTPVIFGDGKQTRDFVYVKDVVRANLLAMESQNIQGGEVFNIATGEQRDLLTLLKLINHITGKNIEAQYKPARKGDIKHSLADISKAEKILAYQPSFTLEEGLFELLKSRVKAPKKHPEHNLTPEEISAWE